MKTELKNKISLGLWLLFGLAILVLFVAAMQHKNYSLCFGCKVEISANHQNYFITEKEILEIVNASGNIEERAIKTIDIAALETALKNNAWIKNAELYFENNNVLHVDIEQRQPIARLFTVNGNSVYLDKNALRLPIKNTATARVVVVTNFPSDNDILAQTDSMLLMEVKQITNYINIDTFLNAQIAQVNITTSGKFELIPTIGNHIILLGDARNLKEKFDRLFTFYAKAWLQNGINNYEVIDVRFNNQVVATRKGTWQNVVKDSAVLNLHLFDSLKINNIDSMQNLLQ